jgi:hypothetical protein
MLPDPHEGQEAFNLGHIYQKPSDLYLFTSFLPFTFHWPSWQPWKKKLYMELPLCVFQFA